MSIQSRKGSTAYLYCLNKHTFTDQNILNHISFPQIKLPMKYCMHVCNPSPK